MEPIGLRVHHPRRGPHRHAPLLLFHGLADHGGAWVAATAELGDRTIVAPDAPGHGTTPLEIVTDRLPVAHSRSIALLLDGLGVGPVDVGGHSMGANVALLLASERPDLVRRVVFEDPPWTHDPISDADRRQAIADLHEWTQSFRDADDAEAATMAREQHPDWSHDEYEPWVDSKRAVDPAVFEDAWFHLEVDDVDAALERLDRPALLLTGDTGRGAIVTASVARSVTGRGPITVSHHPTASHDIRRDDRAGWAAAVRSFLG